MPGFGEAVQNELQNKEFRQSYVEENLRRGLAYQIRAIRDARGWSQAELGRETGRPQSNISRWEDPTYGKFSLQTLLEIAAAFDVALIVKFAPFAALLEATSDLSPAAMAVPSFEEELRAAQAMDFPRAAEALLDTQGFTPKARRHRENAGAGLLQESGTRQRIPSATHNIPTGANSAAPRALTWT
jgi:transcriptional regulator with XRE-family HTH domain